MFTKITPFPWERSDTNHHKPIKNNPSTQLPYWSNSKLRNHKALTSLREVKVKLWSFSSFTRDFSRDWEWYGKPMGKGWPFIGGPWGKSLTKSLMPIWSSKILGRNYQFTLARRPGPPKRKLPQCFRCKLLVSQRVNMRTSSDWDTSMSISSPDSKMATMSTVPNGCFALS